MISFRSKIVQALFSYLFLHNKQELYVNQMARLFDVDRGNLVRKLHELEKEGFLKSRRHANLKYYSLNSDYPLLNEYKKIVLKTVGIEHELKEVFSRIKGVKHLYIYGSYAQDRMDAYSDIDLLIVGKCPHLLIEEIVSRLQRKIHREINVIDFDEKEFQNRKEESDPFITDILDRPNIKII